MLEAEVCTAVKMSMKVDHLFRRQRSAISILFQLYVISYMSHIIVLDGWQSLWTGDSLHNIIILKPLINFLLPYYTLIPQISKCLLKSYHKKEGHEQIKRNNVLNNRSFWTFLPHALTRMLCLGWSHFISASLMMWTETASTLTRACPVTTVLIHAYESHHCTSINFLKFRFLSWSYLMWNGMWAHNED